jgi:leader peptidase (prepilin peptidase)/N-methyltransferase
MPRRKRKRKNPNWLLRFTWLAGLGLLIGIPILAAMLDTFGRDSVNFRRDWGEALMSRSFETILGFWFFLVGSCIGSFLNVVAWRMPQGMTISGFSICPYCRTAIQSRDNIPLLGWLGLRGRCRECRLPISARYPIIEVLCGLGFVALYGFEVLTQARNLPLETPIRSSYGLLVGNIDTQVLFVAGAHLWILTFLFGISLIRLDRRITPLKWVVSGWIGWVLLCLWRPDIMPVPWRPTADDVTQIAPMLTTFMSTICGLAAGLTLGRVVLPMAFPHADGQLILRDESTTAALAMLCSMGLVGSVFGWQAFLMFAVVLGMISMLFALIRICLPIRRPVDWKEGKQRFCHYVDLALICPVAYLVSLAGWQFLDRWQWIPGAERSVVVYVTAIGMASLLIYIAQRIVTQHWILHQRRLASTTAVSGDGVSDDGVSDDSAGDVEEESELD